MCAECVHRCTCNPRRPAAQSHGKVDGMADYLCRCVPGHHGQKTCSWTPGTKIVLRTESTYMTPVLWQILPASPHLLSVVHSCLPWAFEHPLGFSTFMMTGTARIKCTLSARTVYPSQIACLGAFFSIAAGEPSSALTRTGAELQPRLSKLHSPTKAPVPCLWTSPLLQPTLRKVPASLD